MYVGRGGGGRRDEGYQVLPWMSDPSFRLDMFFVFFTDILRIGWYCRKSVVCNLSEYTCCSDLHMQRRRQLNR